MFCELFGFSKQAYYKLSTRHSLSEYKHQQVKKEIQYLRRQMPRLGTRKLHYLLKENFAEQQIKIGRDGLFSLLRNEGLLIIKRKKIYHYH